MMGGVSKVDDAHIDIVRLQTVVDDEQRARKETERIEAVDNGQQPVQLVQQRHKNLRSKTDAVVEELRQRLS